MPKKSGTEPARRQDTTPATSSYGTGGNATHGGITDPFALMESVTLSDKPSNEQALYIFSVYGFDMFMMLTYGMSSKGLTDELDRIRLIIDLRCLKCRYKLTHLTGDCLACHGSDYDRGAFDGAPGYG
jgi:hypothetical protein